jgi:y4mF family transcriptional regulator
MQNEQSWAVHIKTAQELGQAIRSRRKARGYTQMTVADFAGVSTRFLSELEHGKATAEIGKILQVLAALGMDIALLSRGR